MALIVKDRVKQSAAAPGTGTVTLGSTPTGFQSFAAVGNTNTTYFAIVDPISGDWEVNYGVYTSSGTTLTRNATPLSSSNSGSLVNFTGAVDVFVTYPSEKAVYEDTAGVVTFTDNPIFSAGTANGVTYLNGSKVLTSGSALTFDGSKISVNGAAGSNLFQSNDTSGATTFIRMYADTAFGSVINIKTGDSLRFATSADNFSGFSELMRLTSTSLYTASGINVGIGTDNPLSRFNIKGVQGNWRVDADSVSSEIQLLVTNTVNTGFLDYRIKTNQTIFDTGGTERIRITSTGIFKKSSTNGGLQLMDGNTAGGVKIGAYTSNFLANGYLAFEGYSIEYGRFDASGNFLIGATTSGGILTLKNNPNAASENVILAIQANGAGTTTVGKLTYNQGDDTMRLFNTSAFAGAALIFSANNTDALRLTVSSLYTADTILTGLGTNSLAGEGRLVAEYGAVVPFSGTGYRLASFRSTAAANADQPGIALGFDTAGAGIIAARTNAAGQPIAFWTYSGSWGERVRITAPGEVLVGTLTNTNSSKLVVNGTISQTVGGTQYLVVDQSDIGTAPNEIPLNQYLGKLAYEDTVGLFATLNPAPTIASAATIQPLAPITFISGTTTINTITVPAEFVGGGQITLIPTALWSTGTSGNIAIATTGVVSKALIMTYDATTTKWYPSY